ncbi:sodium:solute symporter [Dinghuibacter silviterrae]|uniref:SSS family transporter n=1 Tax=Dinghuibacter silviterrae TaxID=1539049 RepID=A0A4R8DGP0_9BACT|nr:sodium:solute symporter [Dinghuibacter silviterrae]TDW96548.1 SSS family transporter [Dinghuibacter silviterrae]
MSVIDWIVLVTTLLGVTIYGVLKSRGSKNLDGYFLGDRSLPWYIILLSIMGTQASAITFLSAPGQAYTDGMRFVQYYFGLPLAMIVLCIVFVPLFHRLKVYTAYEYLERRFDVKTRTLTSSLFLLQRGLSTGISIYAPSIILSSLLGWNIYWTNAVMGGLLIVYTVTGGARAVAYTQQLQLIVIFASLAIVAYMVIHLLPQGVGLWQALHISGRLGRLNALTTGVSKGGFDWTDKYNIWSGLIGGFFLALSYFGTDQSQVGRYLTARSIRESRLGLLMNGLVKIPMQFAILLLGALVFVFYQFYPAPLFFNKVQTHRVETSAYRSAGHALQTRYDTLSMEKQLAVSAYADAVHRGDTVVQRRTGLLLNELHQKDLGLRQDYRALLDKPGLRGGDDNDTNYIFLRFVVDYLPMGMVGLLIAVIFLAAWGSIAAALNALASCSVVDIHKKFIQRRCTDHEDVRWSRWYTLGWGLFCILTAQFASRLGSLIEAVNVLGSLFYGTILGIFLVAFYVKRAGGSVTFWSAVVVECFVIALFKWSPIGFLWLNAVGALGVVVLAWLGSLFFPKRMIIRPEGFSQE